MGIGELSYASGADVVAVATNLVSGLLGVAGGLLVFALGQRATVREARVQARVRSAQELLGECERYESYLMHTANRPGSGVPPTPEWRRFTTAYRLRARQLDWPDVANSWRAVVQSGTKLRQTASTLSNGVDELRSLHIGYVFVFKATLEQVIAASGEASPRRRWWQLRRRSDSAAPDAGHLRDLILEALDMEGRLARMDLKAQRQGAKVETPHLSSEERRDSPGTAAVGDSAD